MILSNRRYAEIYRLAPEQIRPGMTLREIVELRVAAGTCATAAENYLSFYASRNSGKQARTWTVELRDGRTIQIRHQPMPDGGWVTTHEDVTELKATRAVANERVSLQALIDWLPDNLWVKDVNSRFVIANQVTASRMGFAGPADLIGKTDLELLPPEIAQKFFADEQTIVRSGTTDDRHGGMRIRRLGRQDVDIDDESAAAQRPRRNLRRRGRLARHHRAQAGGRACATGRRKSSK